MKVLVAGVLSLGALAANVAHADMFDPTGGILSSLGSATVIDGLGSFEVQGEQRALVHVNPVLTEERVVAWGNAEAVLDPYSISLSGASRGSTNVFGPGQYVGRVSGTFEFDVLEARSMLLDWDFTGIGTEAQVSIYGTSGSLMSCVGDFGCAQSPTFGSPTELAMLFAPGHYELRFSSVSDFGTGGQPSTNTFSLNITPVPLPAAAWLLLSGLGGLGLLRRRRVL